MMAESDTMAYWLHLGRIAPKDKAARQAYDDATGLLERADEMTLAARVEDAPERSTMREVYQVAYRLCTRGIR